MLHVHGPKSHLDSHVYCQVSNSLRMLGKTAENRERDGRKILGEMRKVVEESGCLSRGETWPLGCGFATENGCY